MIDIKAGQRYEGKWDRNQYGIFVEIVMVSGEYIFYRKALDTTVYCRTKKELLEVYDIIS